MNDAKTICQQCKKGLHTVMNECAKLEKTCAQDNLSSSSQFSHSSSVTLSALPVKTTASKV